MNRWYKFLFEEKNKKEEKPKPKPPGFYSYRYSSNAVAFIKLYENFKESPYQKKGDKPTIGYGTTLYVNDDGTEQKVTLKDEPITREEADIYLRNYLNKIAMPSLNRYLKNTTMTQNQIDALISIMYNKGNKAMLDSRIFEIASKDPNNPNLQNIFIQDAKGISGLIKRRMAEYELFSSKVPIDYRYVQ